MNTPLRRSSMAHVLKGTGRPKPFWFRQLCLCLYLIDTLLILLRRTRTVLFCVCKVSLHSFDIMPPKSLLSIIIIIISQFCSLWHIKFVFCCGSCCCCCCRELPGHCSWESVILLSKPQDTDEQLDDRLSQLLQGSSAAITVWVQSPQHCTDQRCRVFFCRPMTPGLENLGLRTPTPAPVLKNLDFAFRPRIRLWL